MKIVVSLLLFLFATFSAIYSYANGTSYGANATGGVTIDDLIDNSPGGATVESLIYGSSDDNTDPGGTTIDSLIDDSSDYFDDMDGTTIEDLIDR